MCTLLPWCPVRTWYVFFIKSLWVVRKDQTKNLAVSVEVYVTFECVDLEQTSEVVTVLGMEGRWLSPEGRLASEQDDVIAYFFL